MGGFLILRDKFSKKLRFPCGIFLSINRHQSMVLNLCFDSICIEMQSAGRSLRLSGALFCRFWPNFLVHRCQWLPYVAEYP